MLKGNGERMSHIGSSISGVGMLTGGAVIVKVESESHGRLRGDQGGGNLISVRGREGEESR